MASIEQKKLLDLTKEEATSHRPIKVEWLLDEEDQKPPTLDNKVFVHICRQATDSSHFILVAENEKDTNPEQLTKETLVSTLTNLKVSKPVAQRMSESLPLGSWNTLVPFLIGPRNLFAAIVQHPEGRKPQPSNTPFKIKLAICHPSI